MGTNRRDFLKTLGGVALFRLCRVMYWEMALLLQVIN